VDDIGTLLLTFDLSSIVWGKLERALIVPDPPRIHLIEEKKFHQKTTTAAREPPRQIPMA
jgi:hypothetical protein